MCVWVYQSILPIPDALCSVCNISVSYSENLFVSPPTPKQEIHPCYPLANAYSRNLLLPSVFESLHFRTGSEGSPCRDDKGTLLVSEGSQHVIKRDPPIIWGLPVPRWQGTLLVSDGSHAVIKRDPPIIWGLPVPRWQGTLVVSEGPMPWWQGTHVI
jgi:hypothetical protein